MASAWFLAVAGLTGDSTAVGHENALEVGDWSWGLSNTSSPGSGSGSGSGRPVLDDVVVTLASAAGALQLVGMCATGRHAQTATLTGVRSGGGQPFTFLRYELQRVTVISVAQVATEDGSVSHRVALRFGGMRAMFTPQTSSGAPGTPVRVDVGTVTP
ncbi:MAG TPA: type VI secretion system tube protein Hcp [Propionibacteriaceae bacterium]|nr:type VI secretion system tube protein Hcp [Propionibacteriaceae bacterium]